MYGQTAHEIEIEETYLRIVMDRYSLRTMTEAVELALRHLAGQPMSREEARRCAAPTRSMSRPRTNPRGEQRDPR